MLAGAGDPEPLSLLAAGSRAGLFVAHELGSQAEGVRLIIVDFDLPAVAKRAGGFLSAAARAHPYTQPHDRL